MPLNLALHRLSLAAALVSVFFALGSFPNASAQVTNDWLNATSGDFSTAANWATNSGPVPTDGVYNTNLLRFFGAASYAVSNNFATVPFQLHGMRFQVGGAASTLTMTGGQLQFLANGVNPSIIFQNGIGRISIENDILADTDLILAGGTAAGQRGNLTNSGVISGTGRLIKTGIFTNSLVNPGNTFSGGYVLAQGRTFTDSPDAASSTPLGTGPVTLTAGTLSARIDGSNVTHIYGPGSGYDFNVVSNATFDVGRLTTTGTNVVVQINAITNLAVFTVNGANGHTVRAVGPVALSGNGSTNRFNNGGTLRLDGLISELTPGSVLDKSGGGTLTITNLQNHTYSGGTVIRAGTVTVLTGASVTNPLGTSGEVTMYGGTLALRDTASRTVGSGANINGGNGYNLTVAGTNANAIVDVNRYTGASQNGEMRLNNLALSNGASFQVNGGNNYTLAFLGGTFLGNGTNNIINVNNARSTQPFSLRLVGPMTSANPTTARLIKQGGYQELGYVNTTAPDHQGGTWVTAGGLTWRPAGLAAGSYGFGGGAITIDNGASFRFQNNQNSTYTLTNDFFIQNTLHGASGRANYSGGRIDTARQAANPLTILSGDITSSGDVKLNAGPGGAYGTNNQPLTLTGITSVRSDDITIFAENDGDGTGERIVIRGPLTSDNLNRRVKFSTLNGANLELTGDLTGLGSIFVTRGYVGNMGYVKFTTNALPAGRVTVAPGAAVSVGLQAFLPNAATPFSSLSNSFNLMHGAVVLLDRTNVNGALTYGGVIDLSATGLNRDIRIGAGQGYTTVLTNSITPFATTYKLGASEGVLQLTRTNQITGANSLNVGSDPGFDPNEIVSIAPLLGGGTLILNTNNDFTGGTLVNSGFTLDTRHTNALGSGAVTVYGVLNVRHGGGTLTADGQTNLNALRLQPGSTLQFENNELTVTNRFGDAESIVLNGATVRLLGRNAANQFNSEMLSNLFVNGGSRIQTDQRSTGGTILLGFTNISRGFSFTGITNGTLQLVPNSSGQYGTTNRIIIADTSSLGIDHNGMVAPWVVNQGAGHHYLTYDATQLGGFDIGLTNFANYFTGLTGADTGAVANVTGLTDGLTADQEIWAMRLNSNSRLTNNGSVLTIRSGGLLAAGNATNDANLVFRDAGGSKTEAIIYVNGTLRTLGTNDASLITKFGDGNLQLGVAQPGYTNGWSINRGTLEVNLPSGSVATGGTNYGLGSGDPSNFINLNGNSTLTLTTTGTNITYASGKISSWDNNIITANLGNQDERRQFFAPHGIDLNSISNGPLGSQLRVDISRTRSELHAIGAVTLNANALLNIRDTGGASGNTGGTNRLILDGGLVGAGKLLVKIGNGVLELPTDNSATFTGGEVRINGGALSVGHNGAFGDINTLVNVASNAVLELNAALTNFQPVATVTQHAGSAERWLGAFNRFNDDATLQTYVVPTNVSLQISHVQNNAASANSASKTIRLQGGGLEGWQFTGDNRGATITVSNNIEFTDHLRLGRSDIDVGRGGLVSVFNGSFTEINSGLDLVKVGGDTVQIGAGAKNYTGLTRVLNGELRNGVANAIATGRALYVGSDGRFNLNNFAQSVAGLSGSGMLTNSGGGGAEVFTITGAGTNLFSGSIGGAMAFTKSGSGTQILSGASTYSGGTLIDGGSLILNNTEGSGTGTGAVNIRTNGTLGGSGFIAGNVTNLGGVVAPGNSPGNLSIGGNFTATNFDSVAEFEIAGPGGFANAGVTYDLISVGGDVNIGGSALSILTTPFAGGWQIGDQYRLINNLGANPIVGFFSDGVGGASLFQGSSVFLDGGGVELTLDYLGGTGNDLVLTVVAVPEPQTIGLMVIGGALCAWHVFRRRRQ